MEYVLVDILELDEWHFTFMFIQGIKVKVFPLEAIKAQGDVDARVHIFAATAPRRGRVPSPTLDHLYPLVLILQEAEWTEGPVWTQSSVNICTLPPSGIEPWLSNL